MGCTSEHLWEDSSIQYKHPQTNLSVISTVLTSVSPPSLTFPGSQWCFVGSVPSSKVGGPLGSRWGCSAPRSAGSGGARWRHEEVHLSPAKTGKEDRCPAVELKFYFCRDFTTLNMLWILFLYTSQLQTNTAAIINTYTPSCSTV